MHRSLPPLSLLSLLLGASAAQAFETTLPLRGDSMPEGTYLRTAGHTSTTYGNSGWAIDFHAAHWTGSSWSSGGSATNEDRDIYGAAIYAPFDGWIVGCWNDIPDKAAPGVDYDFDGDGVADSSPLRRGNHVQLLTADEAHVTLFAHMQHGSIPSSLCPTPADRDVLDATSVDPPVAGADGWPDDTGDDCQNSGEAGIPRGTMLPTRVWVDAGTFLGRVGNSGASRGPHLHLQTNTASEDTAGNLCLGDSEEMLFSEDYAAQCDSSDIGSWDALDEENPLAAWPLGAACASDAGCPSGWVCSGETGDGTVDGVCTVPGPTWCFLPDAIGDETDRRTPGDDADNLHVVTDADGATVAYQSNGNLRLRTYDITSSGSISQLDAQFEGGVQDVALTRPLSGTRDVVASIRGNNGLLKHIPYRIDGAGITRMSGQERTDGSVGQVAATTSPTHGGFVVAVETSAGDLKVIDYDVDASLNISRNSPSYVGGSISDVDITEAVLFDGVVTAELSTTGQLVLRSFAVPSGGGVTPVDSFGTLVFGSDVHVENAAVFLSEYVATTVTMFDGTLRLDLWHIASNGTITWEDTLSTGEVLGQDLVDLGGGDLASAVVDASGDLRIIGWHYDWLTGDLRRTATRELEDVDAIAVGHFGTHLVTAQADPGGALSVVVRDENFLLGF
ncbi:MAG: hypothetical protein R3F59_19020 [Myxococcota bacterium]